MTTSSTLIGASVGAGAGLVLVAVELALGDELEHIESAAVGVAVMGVALTTFQGARGGDERLLAAYWGIAALAGIPAVAAYWARRKINRVRQLGIAAGRVAERNYSESPGESNT